MENTSQEKGGVTPFLQCVISPKATPALECFTG